MQDFLSHDYIVWDGRLFFNFYIHFCAPAIRSIKDLVICVIEKINICYSYVYSNSIKNFFLIVYKLFFFT